MFLLSLPGIFSPLQERSEAEFRTHDRPIGAVGTVMAVITNMAQIRTLSTPEKKRAFLALTKAGVGRIAAASEVGITIQAVTYWRGQDAEFRQSDDRIKQTRLEVMPQARESMPSFPEFCEKYLDTKLFNHHLQWVDLLEDREPRNLHPNQRYFPGDGSGENILINTPPEHAKSTTITVNYVTYRICEDPNIRVIIVSQTQELAKRFLVAIKDRLAGTNLNYRKLQIDFGPDGGFDKDSASWSANAIYVSSNLRDSGEPTPTVQAIGLNGQIYGNRADIVIMDDCVTGKNAHEWQKQMDWIQREVSNRLSPGGKMLLIGTRLSPTDLYSEIMKDEHYGDEESPWTYLSQPAVLDFDDDPNKWNTLWPYSNRPPVSATGRAKTEKNEKGLYPYWTGPELKKRRAKMSPRNWALVYQQEQFIEDAIFPQAAVLGSVDGGRQPGPMPPGTTNGRPRGIEGCYVVGGFDPAVTGNSAAVCIAMDRTTGIRWVLDVWTSPTKPDDIFDKIKEWTVKYKMNEWRIEKNAMNLMVTQNREIRQFLASRGCLLREHFTGSNKWDTDFGVASMSMLFDGWKDKRQLIRLPNKSTEGVRALIEQLTTWEPEPPGRKSRKKTDCVMALWFAEIRCRELVDEISKVEEFHFQNNYLSERDKSNQVILDLDYMSQAAMHGDSAMSWWSG